jgi:hypothetical protein
LHLLEVVLDMREADNIFGAYSEYILLKCRAAWVVDNILVPSDKGDVPHHKSLPVLVLKRMVLSHYSNSDHHIYHQHMSYAVHTERNILMPFLYI